MTELKQALREIVDMILHTTEVGVEEIRYHQYLVPSPITHPVIRPSALTNQTIDEINNGARPM